MVGMLTLTGATAERDVSGLSRWVHINVGRQCWRVGHCMSYFSWSRHLHAHSYLTAIFWVSSDNLLVAVEEFGVIFYTLYTFPLFPVHLLWLVAYTKGMFH